MAYEFIERMDMQVADGYGVLEHWHRYLSVLELCRQRKVLDLACGTGYGSHLLADFAESVIGVDISQEAINIAKTRYAHKNLVYMQGSATDIPLPNSSVECVISFETIEHLNKDIQPVFLKEVKRVLSQGGCFVVSTPCHEKSVLLNAKNPFHPGELSLGDFTKQLQSIFPVVRVIEQRVSMASILVPNSRMTTFDYHAINNQHGEWLPLLSKELREHPDYYIAICSEVELPDISYGVVADEKNCLTARIYDSGVADGVRFEGERREVEFKKVIKSYRKLENDYSALTGELARSRGEPAAARDAYRKLEGDYRQLTDELKRSRGETAAARDAYGKLEGDYMGLVKELDQTREAVAERDAAYRGLEKTYRELEALFAKTDAEKGAAESLLVDKALEIERLRKACDEWACGKVNAECERNVALGMLEDLRSSPSWRLTSPLRKIKHMVRNVHVKLSGLRSRWRAKTERRRLVSQFKECELVFDHNLGGGANDYRNQYIANRLSAGRPCILVHNNLWYYENRDFSVKLLTSFDCKDDWHFATWSEVAEFLESFEIGRIVYNNLVYNPAAVDILGWIARQKVPLTVMVHDFFCICQFFDMITPEGQYCAGKADCDACAERRSDKRCVFGAPVLASEWRKVWSDVLAHASEIRIFSPFAETLLRSVFPRIGDVIRCMPHDTGYFSAHETVLSGDNGLRLGVVGSIYGVAKGSGVLAAFADRYPEVMVDVIGTYSGIPKPNLVVHGRYDREALPNLLRDSGINVVLFPSICPETFSYTVSELMQMHVPLIAFDVGAQGAKIAGYDRGMIIPSTAPESVMETAQKLYNRIYAGAQL